MRTKGRLGNRFYLKGRRKEYKICKDFKKRGYDVTQRTAGSHSPIDVIAINSEKKIIKLIQSKPNNYAQEKTRKLHQENKNLSGSFLVSFDVI